MYNYSVGLKHSTIKSLDYANQGLKTAFKKEPNFRYHLIITLIAIALAYFLGFDRFEWIILILVIGIVIIMELINTSLEAIVNITSPGISRGAKIAKDVSAAAVMMASLLSLVVGAILFLPKILDLLLK